MGWFLESQFPLVETDNDPPPTSEYVTAFTKHRSTVYLLTASSPIKGTQQNRHFLFEEYGSASSVILLDLSFVSFDWMQDAGCDVALLRGTISDVPFTPDDTK